MKLLPRAAAGGLLFAALVAASSANALTIEYSINGGPLTALANGGSVVNPGGVNITILGAGSNSPGNPTLGDLFSAAVDVFNKGTATSSLKLLVFDTGFTAPTAPPGTLTLSSQVGGTVIVGSNANTLAMSSCVGGGACPGTFNTANLTPTITATNAAFASKDSLVVPSLSAPFAIGELLNFELGAGTSLNFSASTDLAATPLPGAIGLFAGGLGLLGFAGMRKSRKAQRLSSAAAV